MEDKLEFCFTLNIPYKTSEEASQDMATIPVFKEAPPKRIKFENFYRKCPFLCFQMLVPAVVFITLGKCNCCWNESLMVRMPLTSSILEDQADGVVFVSLCVVQTV